MSPVSEQATLARARYLTETYDARGGCLSGDQLTGCLTSNLDQPISVVARWLVNRRIVCFLSGGQTLIPLFQFDLEHSCVRRCVVQVIAELSVVFDDCELADWFVSGNPWIGGAVPADLIDTDSGKVLDAARAVRFLMRG